MEKVLMKCGCVANAKMTNDKPCCAFHFGFTPDAEIIVEAPNLDGRKAHCCYCKTKADSKLTLPFFESMPDKPEDRYYCGCRGWE